MTDENSRAVGRPSDYSLDVATEICGLLATGKPLVAICRDERMPGLSTVYRWLAAHEEFRELYIHAREDQADTLADEILEIADDGRNDWMTREESDGGNSVFNSEHVQRSRLRVDARKWIAAKLKPKKYGDRTILAGDPNAPLEVRSVDELTDAQLAAIATGGRAAASPAPGGSEEAD